jgi:hypothetical protein
MKRSHDVDFDALFDSLDTGPSTGDDDRPATEASDSDEEWDDEDDD